MSTPRSTPRTARRALLGLALAIAVPASGAAAPSPSALRACIANGLTRYTVPDRSAVAQYVDVASACQSALQGGDSAQVSVTPLGGQKKTTTAPASSSDIPARPKRAAAPSSEPSASSPAAAPTTAVTPPTPAPPSRAGVLRTRRTPAPAKAHPRRTRALAAASLAQVRVALAQADRAGAAAPAALGSSPVWPIVIGAIGLVAVAGGIGLRLWRRPR